MDSQILINSHSTEGHHEPSPLLRLPDELLDEIINLAQFCRETVAHPALADLVKELGLVFDCVSNDSTKDNKTLGGDGPEVWDDAHVPDELKVVRASDLSALLARLSRLEVLKLDSLSYSLFRGILCDEATLSSLRRLKSLSVSTWETEDVPDVRPNAWLRRLACSPSLETLELINQGDEDDALFSPGDAPMPLFASVTKLALGQYCDSWTGPALRDIMPNLVELELSTERQDEDFQDILSGAPRALRRLSLRGNRFSPPRSRAGSAPDLERVAQQFKNLEHLGLGPFMFSPDDLLPLLANFTSLRSLTFEHRTPATDTLLLSLLSGPSRLAHLRLLTIDHLYALRGPTIASKGGRLPPDMRKVRHPPMHDGWFAPDAVQGCSAAGVAAAVEAGRAHGVRVEGTALSVIGWVEEHAEEEARAKALWGEDGPRLLQEEIDRQPRPVRAGV
ncbi:hypothetical protein JCM8208_007321 [Rhodotorula glutinis]